MNNPPGTCKSKVADGLSSGYQSAADKAVKGGSYKHHALFSFLLQVFIILTFHVLCLFYEVYFIKGEQTSISYRRKLTKRGLKILSSRQQIQQTDEGSTG